ncbi:MAG: DNA polymerase III subunit alpha [Patescibacteria group bacterium]
MAKSSLAPSDFVHLHNHTHYSLLDGLQKIPEMLDGIKEMGMKSVAITDHGTLSGAIEFYKGCKARDLNPIIGMETYVANRKHTDRDPQKDRSRFHLILLAMNNQGYENLMRLSTIANLDGFYHKPRVDHDLLDKYNEGLIALSGCMGGEVSEHIIQDQPDKAEEIAQWYKSIFGDRYYIELQDHGHNQPRQAELNDKLLALADKLDIPAVVTSDAHYLHKEDEDAHEILLCVQTGSFLADTDRMSLAGWELYVEKPEEVIARWADTRPDVVSNTRVIADRCNIEIELDKILIPKFPTPSGQTEKEYLHLLTYQGLAWRYGDVSETDSKDLSYKDARKLCPKEVVERAEYELGVMDSMGFNGYFLIVWDFCIWGKDQGIVFGPGRGSAAGSIVSYALRITEVDPLEYDLLFERFLNPDRISMPDIDIDIQDTRRGEVITYVSEKYGEDRVANIVTFGKMAARNAVRDVSRVLQVPYAEADRLAKMIPAPIQGRHIPLKVSLEENNDLKAEYDNNPQSKRVFDMATRLEGTIRNHGVHAAGVVIAPDDIVKYTPLEMAQKGVIATQYSMNPVEDLGLLKMDFLGLSNLTIIKNTLRIIKKVYGVEIDIDNLQLDDKKTYELLSRGDTTGVFQLESSGLKSYLRKLKPSTFEDIAAMVALYRPGPLGTGLVDSFINRKHGREKIEVPHPAFEEAMSTTYGTLVYQEQVMRIAADVCGFTGGETDTLRKAIGKKIREVMDKMETRFIEGGVEHGGVPKVIMEKFWQDLLGFADYAFNKSHSVCYALIAYQTAYLKAHYPAAFMAALMTSDAGDTDRLSIEISECQQHDIEVLAPDVNQSFHEFSIVKEPDSDLAKQIRFGMDAVKNVGHGAVAEIIRARDEGGEFTSIDDFVHRVSSSIVNRKAWESLIKAGAFDRFESRGTLLESLDDIIYMAGKIQKEAASGQIDLFGSLEGDDAAAVASQLRVQLTQAPAIDKKEILQWERELLGLYLSDHPMREYREYLDENTVAIAQLKPSHDGSSVKVGGLVQESREITTKKGQQMAFVRIEDFSGDTEVIVFPGTFSENPELWQQDKIVFIDGRVNASDRDGNLGDEVKIIANVASELTPESIADFKPSGQKAEIKKGKSTAKRSSSPNGQVSGSTGPQKDSRLYIRLPDTKDSAKLSSIKKELDKSSGDTEVVLVLGEDKDKQILRLPQKVDSTNGVIDKLREIVGADSIKIS